MNTETSQDNTVSMSTGERLRQARERLGFTQQFVAERLCLKLSTVRDLEEDKTSPELALTFLRGYIRSYAKLVQLPEEELQLALAKQAPQKVAKVAPMQSFSLGKSRKKRDGWLMSFTWLVLFVVVGLTGAWWWQNHQAQQKDILSMADRSSAQLSQSQSVPLGDNLDPTTVSATPVEPAAGGSSVNATPAPVPQANTSAPQGGADSSSVPALVVSPSQTSLPETTPAAGSQLPVAEAAVVAPAVDENGLVMNFTADCWLQVDDAAGKTLFSGIQKNGAKLNLAGKAPFKLKIGAPAAVQIHYQGKPVDLSRFVKSNRVARLTVE